MEKVTLRVRSNHSGEYRAPQNPADDESKHLLPHHISGSNSQSVNVLFAQPAEIPYALSSFLLNTSAILRPASKYYTLRQTKNDTPGPSSPRIHETDNGYGDGKAP